MEKNAAFILELLHFYRDRIDIQTTIQSSVFILQ